MTSMIRITNPDELKPIHFVMLGLFILALAGNCWLTSAAKSDVLPDGAVEWAPDSALLAIVEVLDLNFAQPTPNGTAVKALVGGIATAVGIVVVAFGLAGRMRSTEEVDADDVVIDIDALAPERNVSTDSRRKHINPIYTAQVLMLAFLAWSLLACTWAHARDFAIPATILLIVQVAWAFVLAYGFNRRGATFAAYLLLGVLAITALLSVLYHRERNPELRASYPIGNPIFLATCLAPGILIALLAGSGGIANLKHKRPLRGLLKIVGCIAALIVLVLSFKYSASRGPALGLAVGLIAIPFFLGRTKIKVIMGIIAVVFIAAAGLYYVSQRDAFSMTGRSASMRVRFYAWDYGLNLFADRPALGYGMGGYTLLADQFARADVEDDPEALHARISHAHNEWLEVAVDLGSIGLVLLTGAVYLTLHGGARALSSMRSRSASLTLAALLAALVAMVIAEFSGVGLRMEGLPLVFYTVIGLVWALARPAPGPRVQAVAAHRWLATPLVVAALVAAFVLADYTRQDFSAARAAYQVSEAAFDSDLDRAAALAGRSYRDRLFAQRKLVALDAMIETNLAAAEYLQDRAVQRAQTAGKADNDATLLSLAEADVERSQHFLATGQAALEKLIAVEPGGFRAGWLQWRLHSILADFALLVNDTEQVEQQHAAAIAGLEAQIERRPYDSAFAARYFAAMAPQADIDPLLDVLARPLRISRVPLTYVQLLNQLAGDERFAELPSNILSAAEADLEPDLPADWKNRWAPERLRLASILALAANDYDLAVQCLETAITLYEKLGADAAIARPICYAELADARFFARPDDPGAAIEAAQVALEQMPRSQLGRTVRDTLANRLVAYHLAAGHEEHARKILREYHSRLSDEDFNALVADQYVEMAYTVFNRASERIPVQLLAWSERALELDPEGVAPWHLAADIAVQNKDPDRVVECIERLMALNAKPANVLDAAERALRAMPDNEAIQAVREKAYRRLRATEQPTPATRPAP